MKRDSNRRPMSSHSTYDLLRVGVGVFQGSAETADWDMAAADVAAQVRRQLGDTVLPARLILLLATPGWCNPNRSLSAIVRSVMRRELDGDEIPLIGHSTPGIYARIPKEHREERVTQGFVAVVLV